MVRLRMGKFSGDGRSAGRKFRNQCARLDNLFSQPLVFAGIDHVNPRPENRHRFSPCFYGAAMRRRIDPPSQPAHDNQLPLREVVCQPLRHLAAISRGPPRADYGHRMMRKHLDISPNVENQGRVRDLFEQRRIIIARVRHHLATGFGRGFKVSGGFLQSRLSKNRLRHARRNAAALELRQRGHVGGLRRTEMLHQPVRAAYAQAFELRQAQPELCILLAQVSSPPCPMFFSKLALSCDTPRLRTAHPTLRRPCRRPSKIAEHEMQRQEESFAARVGFDRTAVWDRILISIWL